MSNEKKILIIDDQPEITEIVEEFINDKYSEVATVTTNSPDEALELIDREEYSLIITDHHMPGKSGVDILNCVRSGDSLNKNKPIVFLTAMKTEVDLEIKDKFEDVIVINKIDQIQKIIDVIEKFLS